MLKKFLYCIAALGVLSTLVVASGWYYLIVANPGSEVDMDNIRDILGKESHVFYRDGSSKLGVFFDQAHRQYIEYDDIPKDFVSALVAAEDERFFSHFGFDPAGIARAMVKNIQAGRVVQGGSTLTQQTAKNLFKRTDRSLKSKVKELLFALRLEHRYEKEDIFEFYANQFYVSGNGHGLGVAARYYFNKAPQELTLLECAFIAGSVKKPNAYNPFIKKTSEDSDKAKRRARVRAEYVLKNMLKAEKIGLGRYQEELTKEIQFNKGQVGFSLDYVMDMVKDAVSSEEVLQALETKGVSNVATSGIKIVTTVEKDIQSASMVALRSELSRLDVRLRGYDRVQIQKELRQLKYKGDAEVSPGAFLFGVIDKVDGGKKDLNITVYHGSRKGSGVITIKGIEKLLLAFSKWKRHLWSTPTGADFTELIGQLRVGDRIWVSVAKKVDGKIFLNLEKYPLVQGGALVMKEGRIHAVAGGVENRFFNRAIDAKRTMGSSFKPFLFAAAIQLGWNPADILSNKRELFVFQNQPYFPRPDHAIDNEEVSISWAGVRSENVASIWLLANLCERLTEDQLFDVAKHIGMAPKEIDGETEPYRTYRTRIRDRYGIVVNKNILKRTAFQNSIKSLEADFIFDNLTEEYEKFVNMHYGLNFSDYKKAIELRFLDTEKELSRFEKKEQQLRLSILENNYLDKVELYNNLKSFRETIMDPLAFLGDAIEPDAESEESGEDVSEPVFSLYFNLDSNKYTFQEQTFGANSNVQEVKRLDLQKYLLYQSKQRREEFWQSVTLGRSAVSVSTLEMVMEQGQLEYDKLLKKLPYSFETLSQIDDFKIMVGLRYLIALAKEMGVESTLEPVLSFPLGSNVVTLMETVRIYEALATGKVTQCGNDRSSGLLSIIDRIEDESGEILYKPQCTSRRVVDKKTSMAVSHILENTVKFGTGRYADRNVTLTLEDADEPDDSDQLEVSVPLLGKTGTANKYTNASFYGFLPGLSDKKDGLVIDGGYTVGVYTGYDKNNSMRKGSTKITGAAGALPTWTTIVNRLIADSQYNKYLDPVELTFTGLTLLRPDAGQVYLKVNKDMGGKVVKPITKVNENNRYQPSILSYGYPGQQNSFSLGRHYMPFWKVDTGDQ